MMSFNKVQFQLVARTINLLNSPSRGNLVNGLPRAASPAEHWIKTIFDLLAFGLQ